MDKSVDKISMDLALKIVEKSVPIQEQQNYENKYKFALKVVEQLYDENTNGLSYSTIAIGVVLFDIMKYTKIEYVEKNFGPDVTMLIFNIADEDENMSIAGYERLFQAHDFLFVKLALRLADIWNCINSIDSDEFRKYIGEYNELRRKILKNCPDLLNFMDVESDLIKYGRNVFSGKSPENYKYDHLSVIANG